MSASARSGRSQEAEARQGGLVGRAGRAVLRAVGGAIYYAIYRRLPDTSNPNPYWSEMHPDDDKGAAGEDRQHLQQPPPTI